ncbi:MAG: hypothetical protein CL930_05420 [Deltaproteobacteria bacterium]|nr:hypothetical protein [Deltaproteobacteria bacterium]
MKLYKVKIPVIANVVIETLCNSGAIEVEPENRPEAEIDLVRIMETYSRRDFDLRDAVKEYMASHSVPYDRYGRTRSRMAQEWGHPTGDDVQRYLARQFVECFMISNFVEEVYHDDKDIYKAVIDIVCEHDVDERALRDEARSKIANVAEGTVDYEIAMSKAMKEVKKRHGLIS